MVVAVAALLLAVVGCSLQPQASTQASPSPSVAAIRPSAGPSTPLPSQAFGESPPPFGSEPSSAAPPLVALGSELRLDQLLAMLTVATEDRTGYDRSLFRHWIDADGDGCNTRREVLIDEAVVPPTVGGGCSLIGGRWVSLYDGLVLTDAGKLDIDHVVALAEAWDSGASAWSADRRMRFANDLDVGWSLIAVS